MKKNIFIIGSGFSSLSAACYLASKGNNVTVFEKNNSLGGRARQFEEDGFSFDISNTFKPAYCYISKGTKVKAWSLEVVN